MDFVIARNPDEGSSLPFLVRLPLGPHGVALKVRDVWPRVSKLYCHRADAWPDDGLDIVERIPVRSCVRRGASIDLVLDRGRENRSQFVFTKARGREVIFWQSARTAKQARPNVTVPTARAVGEVLEIIVDSHERYAWDFRRQQATTVKRALAAGDYAVAHAGGVVGAVERKSLADLVHTLTTGKLRYALAELAGVPHAAVVVEDRYSALFRLEHVRPAVAVGRARRDAGAVPERADRVLRDPAARAGVDVPVPRRRARAHARGRRRGAIEELLPEPGPVPEPEPTTAEVRRWAVGAGLEVPPRGRLRPDIWAAFRAAQSEGAH